VIRADPLSFGIQMLKKNLMVKGTEKLFDLSWDFETGNL
jgi:hypothetical protein